MLREQKKRGKRRSVKNCDTTTSRFSRIAGAGIFHSSIHMGNLKGLATLGERNGLFLSLFGL